MGLRSDAGVSLPVGGAQRRRPEFVSGIARTLIVIVHAARWYCAWTAVQLSAGVAIDAKRLPMGSATDATARPSYSSNYILVAWWGKDFIPRGPSSRADGRVVQGRNSIAMQSLREADAGEPADISFSREKLRQNSENAHE